MSTLGAVPATREFSGRAPCPRGCARLSRERGHHVYARHLLACLDCDRIWTIVLELTVPPRAA